LFGLLIVVAMGWCVAYFVGSGPISFRDLIPARRPLDLEMWQGLALDHGWHYAGGFVITRAASAHKS
jgi:hypothetical protein